MTDLRSQPSILDEVLSVPFETEAGLFYISAFRVEYDKQITECATIHIGDLDRNDTSGTLVRVHSACVTSEVFGNLRCDCAWQLRHAFHLIAAASKGVVVYLPNHEGRGNGLLQKVKSFRLINEGLSSPNAFVQLGIPLDRRDYTPAMLILRRLGITRLQLITNNPAKLEAARSYGFDVVARVPSIMNTADPKLLKYLDSKRTQLGHLIEVPR